MQKRPMIKHSKRITDDDDVYTRRYTAPLKGAVRLLFFGVETSVKIRRYNMACFLVPATEAIITTVAAKVIKSKEKEESVNEYSRAVTPQIRQAGNRLSGLAETAYASLLA